MTLPASEPILSVGLMEDAGQIDFELESVFLIGTRQLPPGRYRAGTTGGAVVVTDCAGSEVFRQEHIRLEPGGQADTAYILYDVPIGRSFHWQRPRDQRFRGELLFMQPSPGSLTVINRIPLEQYLESVIASEMNPRSPAEFLKAHCIISRSWLLAQLALKTAPPADCPAEAAWTDAAAHRDFDVCADDHCQRYHGIAGTNAAAGAALAATRGRVLTHAGEVCDTRFSKCCGGITERFSAAWQDRDPPYLRPRSDAPTGVSAPAPPLADEETLVRFIRSRPNVFCNVTDRMLLQRILPDFDSETEDFFRWSITLPQEPLQETLLAKTGIAFGRVRELRPLRRGASGRITHLNISGERTEKTFAKELEIRRVLSTSHLYSSCFSVEPGEPAAGFPEQFVLRGAGWGHGVGLCQIGAAAMADRGYAHTDILEHYFHPAVLQQLY